MLPTIPRLISRPERCPMSVPFESPIWTTADELAFVRGLYRDKKLKALRVYVRLAPYRVWYGIGMRVEAGIVILEARDLLDDLVKRGDA
jgi:hypothetical protein